MNKAELLRSPRAVRAAAKAAWGEMEKARAKQDNTLRFSFRSPTFLATQKRNSYATHDHTLSSMSVNQAMPRTILRLVRLCPQHAVSSNETPTPSLSSTTTRVAPASCLVLPTSPDQVFTRPSSALAGVWKMFLASIWTASLLTPSRMAIYFLSPRHPKEKMQPIPEKEPKTPSSPIVSMGRFFKRIKL
jgi:hypothetical protein